MLLTGGQDAMGGLLPRWHVGFNITMLRMVSFGLDYHWRETLSSGEVSLVSCCVGCCPTASGTFRSPHSNTYQFGRGPVLLAQLCGLLLVPPIIRCRPHHDIQRLCVAGELSSFGSWCAPLKESAATTRATQYQKPHFLSRSLPLLHPHHGVGTAHDVRRRHQGHVGVAWG